MTTELRRPIYDDPTVATTAWFWRPLGYDDHPTGRNFRTATLLEEKFQKLDYDNHWVLTTTRWPLLSYDDHPVMTTTLLKENFKNLLNTWKNKSLTTTDLRRLLHNDCPVTATTLLKENFRMATPEKIFFKHLLTMTTLQRLPSYNTDQLRWPPPEKNLKIC